MKEKQGMDEKWWVPLYDFGIHVFVAVGVFFIIAVPAIALNFLIQWLESIGIDGLISYILRGTEYFIFLVDILLFWVFIARSTVNAGRRIWAQK